MNETTQMLPAILRRLDFETSVPISMTDRPITSLRYGAILEVADDGPAVTNMSFPASAIAEAPKTGAN